MKVTSLTKFDFEKSHDMIVLPFWKGKKHAEELVSVKELKSCYQPSIDLLDFKGEKEEILWVYPQDKKIKRVLLLGLGEESKCTLDFLRRSYAAAIKQAQKKEIKEVVVFLPSSFKEKEVDAIFDGILLMNYAFDEFKSKKTSLVEKLLLVGAKKKELQSFEQKKIVFAGVYLARDLVNDNANKITPEYLADEAKKLEKISPKIKTTILNKKQIEKEKMELLLAVNRGSELEPRFIIIEYKGDGEKAPIVIVGKGVTYDTGGLSIKPTSGMLEMKADMAGAACVLATIQVIADLKMKINVTAVIPSTENSIDAKSYKLGDVFKSYLGKTVEINNTDAEGRLILADAMAYANKHLKPKCMIDFATLTGGIVVALGTQISGIFSTDHKLTKLFKEASEKTGELIWEMPLHDEYKELLKSKIADMVNSAGKDASSMTAALFLKEFVGDTPWVHFDIAGTAFLTTPKGYYPAQGTGVGIRLLTEFLSTFEE